MENANVQDTHQGANTEDTSQAFETPQVNANEVSTGELSVDDIILGNVDDSAAAFGTPDNDISQENNTEIPPQMPDAKNDPERYQYWQSQASKMENELNQIKTQQQMMQQNMMQQQQMQNAQPEPEVQKFPDAPQRPTKPRNFSREDAYSDSSSESARYLDEVDEWRDNMEEYKDLRHQYDLAVMQDKMEKVEASRVEDIKRQQAYAKRREQIQQVDNLVQNKYGLSSEESKNFIREMSSNESLTMDNLVQLWRMRQGQGNPVGQPIQGNPSPTFQQTKRAQQIPSPMGVMPSTGQQAQGSTEDQIMDKMISDLDSKNPFKRK